MELLWLKENCNELVLVIAKVNLTTICLQETLKKSSNKSNMKSFEWYDYIIRKITISTHLQAIAVTTALLSPFAH